MFPTGEELRRGLAAVLPLFKYDDSGLVLLPRDRFTAWRSFLVMGLTLPPYAVHVLILQSDHELEQVSPHFLLIWLLAYVVKWMLFPLLLLEVGRGKSFEARVPHFISAYNWLTLPVVYLHFVIEILPGGISDLLGFMLMLYAMTLDWFLGKKALGLSGWGAAGLVAVIFFLTFAVILGATDMTELVPKLQEL